MSRIACLCGECKEPCETNTGGAKPFRVSRCHGVAVVVKVEGETR